MLAYIFILFVAAILAVVVALLSYNMYLNYRYRNHSAKVWARYHAANNKDATDIIARGSHIYQDGVQLDSNDDGGMRMLTVVAIIACLIILGLLLFL